MILRHYGFRWPPTDADRVAAFDPINPDVSSVVVTDADFLSINFTGCGLPTVVLDYLSIWAMWQDSAGGCLFMRSGASR
jgi:hypothetical protein